MPYSSPHATRLADLLMRQGEIEAQRAQRRGDLWAGVVRDVAGIPAGIQQRRMAEQEAQERAVDRQLARENVASQIRERHAAVDERGNRQMDEQAAKDLALTTQKVSQWLGDIASAPDLESQRMAYRVGRDALVKEGRLTPEDAPEFYPGQSWVKSRMAMLLPAAERFKQLFPEPQKPIEVSPGATLFDPNQGTPMYTAPKPADPVRPVELSAGSVLVHPETGREIAKGPPPREPQAPVQRFSPRTVVVDGKEVEANYDALTGKYHHPDTGAVLAGVRTAPTADMRNKAAGKQTAALAVDAVRTLGAGIFTKVGPAQRAEAIKRGAEAIWGTDPEFRTYQDSRMALAGTLAVEQQGSRVSDADVKALWLPMVPDAYRDTKESYELKWRLIDAMRGVTPKGDEGDPLGLGF